MAVEEIASSDLETDQSEVRPSRNDPCWCGSGRKYKHCHMRQDRR